ncbi:MAG: 6-phosphogluconolactonase [Actinomycetota bacterium]|nr:6-phosphogluconolactonase [Actinomycetota bacterium]
MENPAEEAAQLIAEAVRAGGHIALAGGSTPRAAYEKVAGMELDWSGATLWFGDERCVPPDDELSNYRMAKEALLDRIDGEPPGVKRMPAEHGPHVGAEEYERELRSTLGEALPRLDLVLLGIGPDVHTASLFPGQPALEVVDRPVVGVEEAGMPPEVPRVTLTLPMINNARRVAFLIAGEDKSDAVQQAFGVGVGPAGRVDPRGGELIVLLDDGAASRLTA